MKSRAEALRNIENHSFDVCVIGGGATGAGCALDAQLRGLKTVLIEAADFGSGASTASTKMVHGGVRYLEQAVRSMDLLEFKVVKRALRERIHMLRNAPYLTGTRQFITPCYAWREVAYYEAGLKLYDWIAGAAGLAPSRFLSRSETLRRIPALNAQGLVGSVAYTDGQFDDARYNIVLVATFVEAGGEALTYAPVVGFAKGPDGTISAAEIADQLTGERFALRAGAFVNATGPFADTIRAMAGCADEPRMRLSRGVHVLLPLEILSQGPVPTESPADSTAQNTDALLVPKTDDGRVLFAIPWMGRLLVGTTDEEVERPQQRGIKADEVDYLLRQLNRHLATRVLPDQIVAGFAGVRPLVTSKHPKARQSDTKKLARDHEIEIDAASGLISIMGGKWTTYRAMAEDTINAVERALGRSPTPCRTSHYPLVGSDGFARDYWRTLVHDFRISEASARHLAAKFGSRATQVLACAQDNEDLMAPLADGLVPLKTEVVFCAQNEMAVTLDDILARRIGLEFYGWRDAIRAAPATADLLATELGWPPEMKQQELQHYVAKIQNFTREAGLDRESVASSTSKSDREGALNNG